MQRLRNACSVAALVLLVAACSGGGGSVQMPLTTSPPGAADATGTILPAAQISERQAAVSRAPMITASPTVSILGSVQSVTANNVLIQGGTSCGMLNVSYTSETVFSGPKIAVGDVVLATGSGSCATQLTATQMIVTSAATTSVGGIVQTINSNYLLVQTGTSCGYLNVFFGTNTAFTGPVPAIGSRITATGTGSCADQLLATTIAVKATAATPTPTPIATPTPKASPTPLATPTPKASPTPIATPTPKPSPTQTPTTTLYVSTTGNDRNPGTRTLPFATIQHGADMARPGSSVSVANGTYAARVGQSGSTYIVLQTTSGTATAPIVIKATNPGMAILDGQNYTTNFCYGFNTGANYVTVSGFTMQHCGEGGLVNNSAGKGNVSSHNVIHDIGQTQSCEGTGRDGIFSGDGVVGFTSDGDTVYNIGRLPSTCAQSWLPYTNDHCIYAYGSNVTIENDKIYNCHSGWGIQIGGGSAPTDGKGFTITKNAFGQMHNPGNIVGDIVTFTPSGGHAPSLYTVSGNTAQNPNSGYFINDIYYAGASSYVVDGNIAAGAAKLIDWGGQTPQVSGSGNSPVH